MEPLLTRIFTAIIISLFLTILVRTLPFLRQLYEDKLFRQIGLPRPSHLVEQVYAHANPGFTWASTVVEISGKKEEVPYPIWSSMVPYHDTKKLIDYLSLQFADRYQHYINRHTVICTVNQSSTNFLGNLSDWFIERESNFFPFDEHDPYPIPQEWKDLHLVLFDINLNTGKTMERVSQYFIKQGWKPYHHIAIFYNDLVPPTGYIPPSPDWQEHFSYIYLATNVIKRWDKQDVAQSVMLVREALANQRSWSDPMVINSLKLLRTKPKVSKLSTQ
ncbi:MAG: hypothetical protein MUO64_20870 [Anaerolineales bacterium]|nr:hypothetical protein [Anaerolineales bacterium]